MRISQKSIYALQFMLSLHLYGENRYMQVKEVSESQNISEKYLEAIVARLKGGKLIQVKRGAHGGYMLTEQGRKASLKDVLDCVESASDLGLDLPKNPGNPILGSITQCLFEANQKQQQTLKEYKLDKMASAALQADTMMYNI